MCPKLLSKNFEITINIDHMDQTGANTIEGVIGLQKEGSLEEFKSDQQLSRSNNCYGIITKSCELMTHHFNYKISNYGSNEKKAMKAGDVLVMKYKDKTISFKLNDKDLGIAFTNQEGPWYLFAYFYSAGDKITIAKCKKV